MKPKLLVLELWALGDLAIGIPFLQAASEKYDVTLLAKPHAQDLIARFCPTIKLFPFVAPWTAFRHKYRLLRWPWREILGLRALSAQSFDFGASARSDPRDHFLLYLLGIQQRFGFPRLGSQVFLTDPLSPPDFYAHRYESWQVMGKALGLKLPPRESVGRVDRKSDDQILVHTGAGQKLRVWPLERYRNLVARLRLGNYNVRILCDADQLAWWQAARENHVVAPQTIGELVELLQNAAVFIGNDSGPGHLAALSGVPTFTLFGPQLSAWFAPLHPQAEWMDGSPCPYKPCFDSCRFSSPKCLIDLDEESVFARVESFVARHVGCRAVRD